MKTLAIIGATALFATWCGYGAADELVPLSEIRETLRANPPRTGEDNPQRAEAFNALDAWALAPDTVYWDGEKTTANPDFLAYYLDAMRGALRDARETEISEGAVVWKLYSSGFLIKTKDATFAFDVVEGPFKDIDHMPEHHPDYVFHWTPAMRADFAALVDVMFITHWHYDHASYGIVKTLVEAGKPVVVPAQLKERWKAHGFADKLTVIEQGKDYALGKAGGSDEPAVRYEAFDGVQYMRTDDDGNYISSEHNAQCNVYLVQSGGMGFLHQGDNRGPDFTPWLKETLDEPGKRLDVWLVTLVYPRTLLSDVEAFAEPFIIPGHEYEMGHKPVHGVNKLINFHNGHRGRIREGRAVVLSWGEKIAVKP